MSDQALPIDRAETDAVAQEFLRHWSPKALVEKGLHATVRDLIYNLQDHGDIVVFSVKELEAVSDWLVDSGIGIEVFDPDFRVGDELRSAVKKLLFAHGRCWGMTNYDMGIEEPDE